MSGLLILISNQPFSSCYWLNFNMRSGMGILTLKNKMINKDVIQFFSLLRNNTYFSVWPRTPRPFQFEHKLIKIESYYNSNFQNFLFRKMNRLNFYFVGRFFGLKGDIKRFNNTNILSRKSIITYFSTSNFLQLYERINISVLQSDIIVFNILFWAWQKKIKQGKLCQ